MSAFFAFSSAASHVTPATSHRYSMETAMDAPAEHTAVSDMSPSIFDCPLPTAATSPRGPRRATAATTLHGSTEAHADLKPVRASEIIRICDDAERIFKQFDFAARDRFLFSRMIRESLALLSVGASCESLSRIDVDDFLSHHPAAAVPEPTSLCGDVFIRKMRESMALLAVGASCESLSRIDVDDFLSHHPAAAVPEPTSLCGDVFIRKMRESMALLAVGASYESLGGIDADTFLSQHPAAGVPEPTSLCGDVFIRKMRESLALLAVGASYESLGGIDADAFLSQHPAAGVPEPEDADTCSGRSSSCGSYISSHISSSAADISNGRPSSTASDVSSSPSSGTAAWSAASSFADRSSCCTPSSGQESEPAAVVTAAVPAEEPTATPAKVSSGRRSGGLKRKLHKLLRGVFGSCVGRSIHAQ